MSHKGNDQYIDNQRDQFDETEVKEQARTCPMHEVLMKRRVSKFDSEVFYSHSQKNKQGEWEYCNGRMGFPSEQKLNLSYRGR